MNFFLITYLQNFIWFVFLLDFGSASIYKYVTGELHPCTHQNSCYYYSINGNKQSYTAGDISRQFKIDGAWDYTRSTPRYADMDYSFQCNPPEVDLRNFEHLNYCFKTADEESFVLVEDTFPPRSDLQLRTNEPRGVKSSARDDGEEVIDLDDMDGDFEFTEDFTIFEDPVTGTSTKSLSQSYRRKPISKGKETSDDTVIAEENVDPSLKGDIVDSEVLDGSESIPDEELCSELQSFYKKRGFLPRSKHDSYCLSGCNFLRVRCDSTRSEPLSRVVKSQVDIVHNFLKGILEEGVAQEELEIDEDLRDTWMVTASHVAPAFLALIPILLNQHKRYNLWTSIFFIFAFAVVQPFFSSPMICLHNALISFLSLVHSDSSHYLVESMASLFMCYFVLFLVFISNPYFQLMVLLTAVVGFATYLFAIFTTKKGGTHAHLLICVVHFLLVVEQLEFIRKEFSDISLLGAGVDMLMSTIMPRARGNYLIFNLCEITRQVANKVDVFVIYKPFILLICMIIYLVLFVAFRGFLGTYCLFTLRYRRDFGAFSKGLFLYMSDVFGPFKAFFRIVFKYEAFNSRRACYVAISILLMVYEVRSALDFFLLRVMVSLVDMLIIKSDIGKVTRYLGEHVDLGNSVFPQDGSFPWISLDHVLKFADHVDWAHFTTADSDKPDFRGVGIVFKTAGKDMLYTVHHLVEDIKGCTFAGISMLRPQFKYVSRSKDPIVCTKIKGYSKDPPSLNILSPSEVNDVKSLLFINLNEDKTKFINVVPRFSIKNEVLHASVDLKPGDSGGPAFAILNNGSMRYCGTVSAGAPRDGGGNIITFVVGNGLPGNDSSDDEYEGNSDVDVNRFNFDRGRLRRATHKSELACYHRFVTRLSEAVDDFEFLTSLPIKPNVSDFESTETKDSFLTALGDKIAKEKEELEYPRKDEPPDEEHRNDEGAHRPNGGKRRAKSSRKDKAARKRALGKVASVIDAMSAIYDPDDIELMYDTMIAGRFPNMSTRDFIDIDDDGNFIYSDSFPIRTHI